MQNMDGLTGEDSQFIVTAHPPILITFPDAGIYRIREDGTAGVPFRETSHYRTTVRFLQNPESAIKDIPGRSEEWCKGEGSE